VAAVDPTPEQVLARCKAGDRGAFRLLFVQHRTDVARLVFRMMGPRAEIEDILQEVFVQVFRSIADFRGDSKFSTWLHRLTVNVVLMHRRAARSRPNLSDEIPAELPSLAAHPEEEVIRRERIKAFYAVLDRLSEKKRTVFILHEIQGLNPTQIALLVGAPVLTVRTRLFYARRDMIQLLRADPTLSALADVMLRPGSADLGSEQVQEPSP
jgi:RNA polymerase sigma-70 factor, ECF subfamily